MTDPINYSDLPIHATAESDAEMLALAAEGDWMEFFALCDQVGNPYSTEGLSACLRDWCRMRDNLGLDYPTLPVYHRFELEEE